MKKNLVIYSFISFVKLSYTILYILINNILKSSKINRILGHMLSNAIDFQGIYQSFGNLQFTDKYVALLATDPMPFDARQVYSP